MIQEVKTNIVSLGFAVACLVLYFFFPIGEFKFEILIGALSFLLLLPILYTKIILKKDIRELGFLSFSLDVQSIFYLASAVVLGGLFAFFVFTLQWGVGKYLITLSPTILQNFGAFIVYELFFTTVALFLTVFFAWGFVYAIKWDNPIYSFIQAFLVYAVLLIDLYNSFWVALPFLIPAFFIQKIRDDKNITYMFIVVFLIALVLDTLIVKSFN